MSDPRKMRRNAVILGAVAVALMVGIGGYFFWREVKAIRAAKALPVLGVVPNFELIERSGKSVSLADLRGKVWVADFIFTHCAGPCPLLSMRMQELQEPLYKMPGVTLVSISVDPERDTPQVFREYAKRYEADEERWLFLTGEKADVYGLIRRGFQVTVDNSPEEEENDQIMHSLRFALVDQKGQVRAYYNGMEPDLAEKLLPDVEVLLRERN